MRSVTVMGGWSVCLQCYLTGELSSPGPSIVQSDVTDWPLPASLNVRSQRLIVGVTVSSRKPASVNDCRQW